MTNPRPHTGPSAHLCRCPAPAGRLWCWRCLGSVKITAAEATRLIRESTTPPAGGGEARPVCRS